MTRPAGCLLIGQWRIIEADLRNGDHLDLLGPATLTIGADGHGEIAYHLGDEAILKAKPMPSSTAC